MRCIYKKDDIIAMPFIINFPNGTRGAVMWVRTKLDGLMISFEAGSIPLK
jgi:hypothetical protein